MSCSRRNRGIYKTSGYGSAHPHGDEPPRRRHVDGPWRMSQMRDGGGWRMGPHLIIL
ncbi:hypothetical protein HanIR_Chr05g0244891 [Helianthus annuus]|nr:hypothetical protein HanIR_Chr05g0244891 [Helianthus annuus]